MKKTLTISTFKKEEFSQLKNKQIQNNSDNYHAIESDILRTFIAPCFKRGNKKHFALRNILVAFANKFPEIGYV